MSLNKWQVLWRSVDEARLIVRVMIFIKLALLSAYIYIVQDGLFNIVDQAMDKNMALGEVVAVLGAVTVFATFTVPILAGMYKQLWVDYRNSGVNWDVVAERQRLAEVGLTRPTPVAQPMQENHTETKP